MKKLLNLLTIVAFAILAVSFNAVAQNSADGSPDTTVVVDSADTGASSDVVSDPEPEPEPKLASAPAPAEEERGFHQDMKKKFIEGGPGFMGVVLLVLIIGLALAIERIFYLSLATVDTTKLLNNVDGALKSGGVEAAKEVCRSTKGPIASIFYQGLSRADEGLGIVEKSIVSYGSVQMGLLEKGLSWISLCIALAPMLGFMGTVLGMIDAFDAIEAAGDISPSLVAGGIKKALLTTVFGLVVAIILQVFYNYIVSKVDSLVNSMEDASISLMDLLIRAGIGKEEGED